MAVPTTRELTFDGAPVVLMGDDPRDSAVNVICYRATGDVATPAEFVTSMGGRLVDQRGTGVTAFLVTPDAISPEALGARVDRIVTDVGRANRAAGIALVCVDDPHHARLVAARCSDQLAQLGTGVDGVYDPGRHATFGDLQLDALNTRRARRAEAAGRDLITDLGSWRAVHEVERGVRAMYRQRIGEDDAASVPYHLVGLHAADRTGGAALSNAPRVDLFAGGNTVVHLGGELAPERVAEVLGADDPAVCWPSGSAFSEHVADAVVRLVQSPDSVRLVVDRAGLPLLPRIRTHVDTAIAGLPEALRPRPVRVEFGPDVGGGRSGDLLAMTFGPRHTAITAPGATRPGGSPGGPAHPTRSFSR